MYIYIGFYRKQLGISRGLNGLVFFYCLVKIEIDRELWIMAMARLSLNNLLELYNPEFPVFPKAEYMHNSSLICPY
jgi:hypothetical protein